MPRSSSRGSLLCSFTLSPPTRFVAVHLLRPPGLVLDCYDCHIDALKQCRMQLAAIQIAADEHELTAARAGLPGISRLELKDPMHALQYMAALVAFDFDNAFQ